MEKRRLLKNQIETERKKRRLVVYTLFLLTAVYLTTSLFFDNMGFLQYLNLRNNEQRLRSEISRLEHEIASLNVEIMNLRGNPFYLEKHAREDLNLARPDEFIFIYER